jgi:hypothetical protein
VPCLETQSRSFSPAHACSKRTSHCQTFNFGDQWPAHYASHLPALMILSAEGGGSRTGSRGCRYVRYRITEEFRLHALKSPKVAYLRRVYLWWRYTLPEYLAPSRLPAPPGIPEPHEREAPWQVPVAVALQRLPVWEHKLDNFILFGHSMPTNAEVEFRRSYLNWCDVALHVLASAALPSQLQFHGKSLRH